MTHLNDISKVYLESIAESAVPGKPAERLGAVTGIPKSEQESAAERIRKKTAAKKAALEKKHGMKMDDHPEYPKKKYVDEKLDPVGQEDGDVDNDGDKDKSDKYLLKRRKAIAKAISSTKKSVKEQEERIGGGNLKKMAAKATKRIDYDVDGDVDKNDPKAGPMGEFVPTPDGKKRLYSGVRKESFSNWRGDLTEVITDIESKPIKEKKVNNKITINPKLGEALEEIGATLIEMVEIDELDYVIDSVYGELLDEGYEEDDVEEVIEYALTEATVTYGHDTDKPHEKDTSAGRMVKAVGRLARQKLKSAGKKARLKSAQAQVAAYNKGREVAQTAGDKARRAKKTVSDSSKKAKTGIKAKIKRAAQKVVDRMSEETVNEAVKGQDTEMRKAAAADRKSGEKRLPPSSGKGYADQQKQSISYMDKLTKKNKNVVGLVTKEEVEQIDEKALSKAQQRFMGMVYAVKKGEMEAPSPEVAKAAASMTGKEAKDFAKTKHKGLPEKKEVKEGATEAPMSPQELALQKRKTAIDVQISKKRQQALQKAGAQKMNEEESDRLKDKHLERGGMGARTNYDRPPAKKLSNAELGIKPGKTALQKDMEKKHGKGKSALDIVKSEIRAKHGKGAIIGDK